MYMQGKHGLNSYIGEGLKPIGLLKLPSWLASYIVLDHCSKIKPVS